MPDWNAKATAQLPDPDSLQKEIAARRQKLLRGIQLYQSHPYDRVPNDMPIIWQSGTTKLYDYGPAGGKPLLIIPSLVNRAYILDLHRNHSFVRFLSAHGIRVFLIDWDAPGDEEKNFGLDNYLVHLQSAVKFLTEKTKQRISLLGYCMGGLFATALAALQPNNFASLVLMATPWDFHKGTKPLAVEARQRQADVIDRIGHMPVDMLQSFFASLNPMQTVKKFLKFADYDMQSTQAEKFVQLEDWLNDGVPLTAKVARECLVDWYGCNTPAQLQWHVGGTLIDPAQIRIPSLALIPAQDRIVPPDSAAALARKIPGCIRIDPPLGHIGMITSSRAEQYVWQPLVNWLGA